MDVISLISASIADKKRFGNDLLNNTNPEKRDSSNFLDLNWNNFLAPFSTFTWQTNDIIPFDQPFRSLSAQQIFIGNQSLRMRDVVAVFYGEIDFYFQNLGGAPAVFTPGVFSLATRQEDSTFNQIILYSLCIPAQNIPANDTSGVFTRRVLCAGIRLIPALPANVFLNGYFRGVLILGTYSS